MTAAYPAPIGKGGHVRGQLQRWGGSTTSSPSPCAEEQEDVSVALQRIRVADLVQNAWTYCGCTKSCTTLKPWKTIVCWRLQENHHSMVSQVVQDLVHPQYCCHWDPFVTDCSAEFATQKKHVLILCADFPEGHRFPLPAQPLI